MRTFTFVMALLVCILFITPRVVAEESSIVFSKAREETKKIALTFDDGPHPRYTERILKILEKHNVKATFFVIGINVKNYPEALKKVHAAGHEIANHTYYHNNEKRLDVSSIEREISECEKIVIDTVGVKPRLFRPPQGDYNEATKRVALDNGYSIILWSVDTRDWDGNSAQGIASTVIREVSGGDIILMHDYVSCQNTTCDALEILIPRLKSLGYEFVSVGELIGLK